MLASEKSQKNIRLSSSALKNDKKKEDNVLNEKSTEHQRQEQCKYLPRRRHIRGVGHFVKSWRDGSL